MSDSIHSIVWLNGELVPAGEAKISPFDHGLLTGDGVFETLAAYDGKPFATRRHHERFVRSASALGLSVPDKGTMARAMTEVLAANKLSEARVRATITGGIGPLGSDKNDSSDTFLVAASPMPGHADLAKVVFVPWQRNKHGALKGVKSTSYGENVIALAHAKKQEGNEAIFGNTEGELCEGTGSNLFLVLDGALITPTLDSGCLAGVTRSIVLDLCRQEGIPAEEYDVPLSKLAEADEAFLTSSLREVQPIADVDGASLPVCPGPVSALLRASFKALVESNIDP
jgi:branched-chain amino acid aminotransferase